MAEQISSLDKPITLADWHEIYQRLLPYLGGNKAVDGNPIGTVITHLGATPPAGYLVCDGSKLSATAFPLLFDVLKELPSATRATWGDADWVTEFNVPNLYGEFPRFSGTNAHENQGSGANVGVHQDATTIQRNISDTTYHFEYFGRLATSENRNADSTVYSSAPIDRTSTEVYTQSTKNSAEITTRPTNTSFLPCIKYTYVTQEVEYSEQERVVGKWIDGKDLYQRVLTGTFGAITSGTVSYASVTNAIQSDVDTLIDNRVIGSNQGQAWVADGSLRSLDGANVLLQAGFNKSNHSFYVGSSNTNLSNITIYMIVRYTKTS